jgi:hypothetical protein
MMNIPITIVYILNEINKRAKSKLLSNCFASLAFLEVLAILKMSSKKKQAKKKKTKLTHTLISFEKENE